MICVKLLFFIQGHNKNSPYHLLTLLKGGYHKRYIFTHEESLKIIDENPQVDVTTMNPEDSMDYNALCSSFYRTQASISEKITHTFTAETCHKNNVLLWLKYHTKVQTRS